MFCAMPKSTSIANTRNIPKNAGSPSDVIAGITMCYEKRIYDILIIARGEILGCGRAFEEV
jgi:hypothetical protein